MTAQNPWLADASVGATMRDYEIRTVADFRNVPEERRRVCLREFHTWLSMQASVPELLIAVGVPRDAIRWLEPDVFVWKDDGEARFAVAICEEPA